MTEVDCFKIQMEMREGEGEGAQVEAAKNALRCFASKPPFYSVKRSSETVEERGGTPVQHLSVPTSSLKVFKDFFPLYVLKTPPAGRTAQLLQ